MVKQDIIEKAEKIIDSILTRAEALKDDSRLKMKDFATQIATENGCEEDIALSFIHFVVKNKSTEFKVSKGPKGGFQKISLKVVDTTEAVNSMVNE